jgi:hypothetical protein
MSYPIKQLITIRATNKSEIFNLDQLIGEIQDLRTAKLIQTIFQERLQALKTDIALTEKEPKAENGEIFVLIKKDHFKKLSELSDNLSTIILNLSVNDVD